MRAHKMAATETSIGISPGFQEILLLPGKTYYGKFSIINPASNTNSKTNYEIIPVPFSVSGENYEMSFVNENDRTQMSKWIHIENNTGTLTSEEVREINYRIDVPENALSGGQYAAITVRIKNPDSGSTGHSIISRSQVAMIIYATVDGEIEANGEIIDNSIPSFFLSSPITLSSYVVNTGNVHSDVVYVVHIENLFTGEILYDTSSEPKINTVVPDSKLTSVNIWEETPALGLFRVTQSISYADNINTRTRVVFVCPTWFLIIWIVFILSCFFWFFSRRRARMIAKKNAADYIKKI